MNELDWLASKCLSMCKICGLHFARQLDPYDRCIECIAPARIQHDTESEAPGIGDS